MYSSYLDECKDFESMGFLYKGDVETQLKHLEEIKKTTVEAENGIIAVTIAPTMECNHGGTIASKREPNKELCLWRLQRE